MAAAAMQAAAYIVALQDLLAAESLPAAAVSTDAILVTPENFSPQATATFIDVRKQVAILRRQLARMARIGALLDELPAGLTFDLAPDPDGTYTRARGELAARPGGGTRPVPAALPEDLRAGRLLPRRGPRRRRLERPRLRRPRRPRQPGHRSAPRSRWPAAPASLPPTRPTSPVRCATPRASATRLAGGAA